MPKSKKPPLPNPYGYVPKPNRKAQPPSPVVGKLTAQDQEHMRQWFSLGFSIAAIAKAYDVTYGYTAQIVRDVIRLQRKK